MDTLIDALTAKYRLYQDTDSTDDAFTDPADSVDPPAGAFDLSPHGNAGFAALRIAPVGLGSEGNTFNIRVVGWREVILDNSNRFWHPEPMYLATVTLGAMTSLLDSILGAGHLYAKTLVIITPPTNDNISSETISSDRAGGSAHFAADMKGCRYATIQFSLDAATGANALVAPF